MIFLGVMLACQSTFRLGCPMKEDDIWHFTETQSVKFGTTFIRKELKCEQRVLDIDDKDVQHIEVECIGGTIEVTLNGDKREPEDPKGETWGFFISSTGMQLEYEEAKYTLDENPIQYLEQLLHTPLNRNVVGVGERWRQVSKLREFNIEVREPKSVNGTRCVGIKVSGKLISPLVGEYKMEQWYRCDNGRLWSETLTADSVHGDGYSDLDYASSYTATAAPK